MSEKNNDEQVEETEVESETETETEQDDDSPQVRRVDKATLHVETLGADSTWVKEQINDLHAQVSEIRTELATVQAEKQKDQRKTKNRRRSLKIKR